MKKILLLAVALGAIVQAQLPHRLIAQVLCAYLKRPRVLCGGHIADEPALMLAAARGAI